MNIDHTKNPDGSLQVVLDITADEMACLLDTLEGVDGIIKWFSEGPSQNKIGKCAERMDREWRDRLDADPAVATVPADRAARIALIQARDDYKDRAARETEARAAAARR